MAAEIDSPTNNWDQMLITMHEAIQAIVTAFPDVPILPVIGNNDVIYHDQAPKATEKDTYY